MEAFRLRSAPRKHVPKTQSFDLDELAQFHGDSVGRTDILTSIEDFIAHLTPIGVITAAPRYRSLLFSLISTDSLVQRTVQTDGFSTLRRDTTNETTSFWDCVL